MPKTPMEMLHSTHTTEESNISKTDNMHDVGNGNVEQENACHLLTRCTTSSSALPANQEFVYNKNKHTENNLGSQVHATKTALDVVMPINATELLQESWIKQRQSVLALDLRLTDAEAEISTKRHRWRMLRLQQERRRAWAKFDLMHTTQTSIMLESIIIAIRDRQTNLRPEGVQAFIFPNNDIYEGNWKNCTLHGKGCLRREEAKDIYEGQWFQGQRCGQGMYHGAHFSFYYSGAWLDNKMHGKGELLELEGMYVGDLIENEPHGFGEYAYHDGHTYRGEWVRGFYEGNGAYLMPCGTRYEGHWRNGKEDGKGRMMFSNGDVYNGEWRKGLPHGHGVYSNFAMRIEGNWSYGSVYGKATCTYSNGCVYVGNWYRGKYNGNGHFIFQSSAATLLSSMPETQEESLKEYQDLRRISYNGEFVNGHRHGYGEYVTQGLQYIGEWKIDAKEGNGKLIIGAEHTTYNGAWQNNLPSGSAVFSVGGHTVTMTSENGECLETTEVDAFKSVDASMQLISNSV